MDTDTYRYRKLTEEEIEILESNGCRAEDWSAIEVAEDFVPKYVKDTVFYGAVSIGMFEKNIEVSRGFFKHSGICRATLRNVSVGDNCLIENIGNFINNYTIGEGCYISNVCTMETNDGATYGQGNLVSVLNEAGEGNVVLFGNLNSQFAAFMVKHFKDKEVKGALRRLIDEDIRLHIPDRGTIGNGVKIVNTKEITNTIINDAAEIDGASRLNDCSIMSSPNNSVYIGTGVICENSIVSDGSSIINSVKMQDCFVGEACQISNGFTASASVFFANSHMSNGEACAAFCGPFSASHHKSSLLIGGQFSFYNAGSATNFSNHAYKMGPIHYGILERGTKTASGCHMIMPANIGAFSVCFGKLMNHPDTRDLPFSYLISYDSDMYIVPGRNIATVGLYRDIRKWGRRDMRPKEYRKSIVNFDWLSPFSVGEILKGKKILEELRKASGKHASVYNYHGYLIKGSSLEKGIKYYDIALRMYMGAVIKNVVKQGMPGIPTTSVGQDKWNDLSGLLLPASEEQRLIDDIRSGELPDIGRVLDRFKEINDRYREYQWAWTYRLILDYYRLDHITEADIERIQHDYINARREWIAEIRKDADKEYELGDVEETVYENFISSLDNEIDSGN
ncbi:MAG: DUF4954 family protein [Prevotella sp.]|uniref:DUF4954 family protein n=1 Tax=Prevotella sp. TaxID=59823 RepID=UPI002A2804B5|nr:DUF4954 family protein [Prevotella sp.]MDD7317823.1 DUF4954 family protein [Prevotellaceae bacterium]MDY4020738.1 DUF4954 family protein [Prevotella sp.]